MRTIQEWEQLYQKANPWGFDGSDDDVLRTRMILGALGTRRYRHALDLGCGEGGLTGRLPAMADKVIGYDISEQAVARARERFPGVEFRQGDIVDVVKRPEVAAVPFDLILAAEVLYYLPSDEERREALAGMAKLGAPDCTYYISVIVVGATPGRRYFTHEGFLGMLAESFEVVRHFPVGVNLRPLAEGLLRAVPFRDMRIGWRRRLIAGSPPARWKHVAYICRKRGAAASRTSP